MRVVLNILVVYLELERVMLMLDAMDNSNADHVRDAMDGVWADMTDEQRAALNNRKRHDDAPG